MRSRAKAVSAADRLSMSPQLRGQLDQFWLIPPIDEDDRRRATSPARGCAQRLGEGDALEWAHSDVRPACTLGRRGEGHRGGGALTVRSHIASAVHHSIKRGSQPFGFASDTRRSPVFALRVSLSKSVSALAPYRDILAALFVRERATRPSGRARAALSRA